MRFWTRLSTLRETGEGEDDVEIEEERRTDYSIFKSLIIPDGASVTLSFVFFAAEVLDRFVIEQAIGVNTTGDLVGVRHGPVLL